VKKFANVRSRKMCWDVIFIEAGHLRFVLAHVIFFILCYSFSLDEHQIRMFFVHDKRQEIVIILPPLLPFVFYCSTQHWCALNKNLLTKVLSLSVYFLHISIFSLGWNNHRTVTDWRDARPNYCRVKIQFFCSLIFITEFIYFLTTCLEFVNTFN
jgi:hypothetical protein